MGDGSIALWEAIEDFLDNGTASNGTRPELIRFATVVGRDCPMFTITTHQVNEFVMEMKKAPERRQRAAVLEAFFQHARGKGWVRVNPATGIIKERVTRKKAVARKRERIRLSSEGRRAIEAKMRDLLVQKDRLVAEVKAAREEGDLRENAGYHDARERLALVESQLRDAEDLLSSAVPDE